MEMKEMLELMESEVGTVADTGAPPEPPVHEGDDEEGIPDEVKQDVVQDLAAAIMDAFRAEEGGGGEPDEFDRAEAELGSDEPGDAPPPGDEEPSNAAPNGEAGGDDDLPPLAGGEDGDGDEAPPASDGDPGDLEAAQDKIESLQDENAELRKRLAAATDNDSPNEGVGDAEYKDDKSLGGDDVCEEDDDILPPMAGGADDVSEDGEEPPMSGDNEEKKPEDSEEEKPADE